MLTDDCTLEVRIVCTLPWIIGGCMWTKRISEIKLITDPRWITKSLDGSSVPKVYRSLLSPSLSLPKVLLHCEFDPLISSLLTYSTNLHYVTLNPFCEVHVFVFVYVFPFITMWKKDFHLSLSLNYFIWKKKKRPSYPFFISTISSVFYLVLLRKYGKIPQT